MKGEKEKGREVLTSERLRTNADGQPPLVLAKHKDGKQE